MDQNPTLVHHHHNHLPLNRRLFPEENNMDVDGEDVFGGQRNPIPPQPTPPQPTPPQPQPTPHPYNSQRCNVQHRYCYLRTINLTRKKNLLHQSLEGTQHKILVDAGIPMHEGHQTHEGHQMLEKRILNGVHLDITIDHT